ncbi:MAG: hypothetical protein AAF754_14165 [Pseudomonadota bacterium]
MFNSVTRTVFASVLACTGLVGAASADTAIAIKTSAIRSGAGTDSNIFMTIYGANGYVKTLRLQDELSGNILEKGDVDTLYLQDDFGAGVTKITVESDGRYSGSDWFLDEIKAFTDFVDEENGIKQPPISYASTASTLYSISAALPKNVSDGVVVSTFPYFNWITGDEESQTAVAGKSAKGVELVRAEPVFDLIGGKDTVPVNVYYVLSADGLDGKQSTIVDLKQTFTRADTLRMSSGTSNRIQAGAEVGVKYQQGKTGRGWTVEGKLSTEYEWVKKNLKEQSWVTTNLSETKDSFFAAPDTYEFRILRSAGQVSNQSYRALMTKQSFTARYLENANEFKVRSVTFTEGELADDVWNRSVAKPLAVSAGQLEYENVVGRLKSFGILKSPLTFEAAQKRSGI